MHQILAVLKSTGIAYNKTNCMHCTNCMQILDHIYVGYISLNLKIISNLSLIFQINCIFITVKCRGGSRIFRTLVKVFGCTI
jgi:Na+/pantothenate symporter